MTGPYPPADTPAGWPEPTAGWDPTAPPTPPAPQPVDFSAPSSPAPQSQAVPGQAVPGQGPQAPDYPGGGYPSGYPYPPAAYPGGYPAGGYGVQPSPYQPYYAPQRKTNGLAIGSLVTSIVGAFLLICYGLGALVGLVGAILGHVARRQIRERQEEGDGMALAGVIVGWIAAGVGLILVAFFVVLFVMFANTDPSNMGPVDSWDLVGA